MAKAKKTGPGLRQLNISDLALMRKTYRSFEEFLVNEVYVPSFRFVRVLGNSRGDLLKAFEVILWIEAMVSPYLDNYYFMKRSQVVSRFTKITPKTKKDYFIMKTLLMRWMFLINQQLKVAGVLGRAEYDALVR